MNTCLRLVLCAGALVALWIGLTFAAADWLSAMGLDVWNLPELEQQLAQECQRDEALEGARVVLLRRIAQRRRVTQDLIAGRLTLLEATAEFRRLRRMTPDFLDRFHSLYPGATEEERVCRGLIAWVRAELIVQPDQAEARAARFEAELQDHLNRNGTLLLPD
jgi:hypothetical protein